MFISSALAERVTTPQLNPGCAGAYPYNRATRWVCNTTNPYFKNLRLSVEIYNLMGESPSECPLLTTARDFNPTDHLDDGELFFNVPLVATKSADGSWAYSGSGSTSWLGVKNFSIEINPISKDSHVSFEWLGDQYNSGRTVNTDITCDWLACENRASCYPAP